MTKKTYIVDGRQFQSQAEYDSAMSDKKLIDKIRAISKDYNSEQLKGLLQKIEKKEIRFQTLLGQDFEDELRERLRRPDKNTRKPDAKKESNAVAGRSGRVSSGRVSSVEKSSGGVSSGIEAGRKSGSELTRTGRTPEQEKLLQEAVERELKKRERIRRGFLIASGLLAIAFLGSFGIYAYQMKRTQSQQEKLGSLVGYQASDAFDNGKNGEENPEEGAYRVSLDGRRDTPEVLEEYKTIYQQHKKLIGWLKFDDKDIGGKYGFPVMQTDDNDFFLSHNSELKSDKNGAIFMDTGCDVLKPSTNFILYGHHMKSGAMFGNLDHYGKEDYWKKYPYFQFDTIYEKGIYQVMYVFRSHVFNEDEITFKYYQFIDCISSAEFDSYMEEMAKLSLYDTGVTAQFGDQLVTLSTCDYQEEAGRFVVVAKKVKSRE